MLAESLPRQNIGKGMGNRHSSPALNPHNLWQGYKLGATDAHLNGGIWVCIQDMPQP